VSERRECTCGKSYEVDNNMEFALPLPLEEKGEQLLSVCAALHVSEYFFKL